MCSQRNICLIILVGIPGSGKTFFRKFLENKLKENYETVLNSVKLCSVCYDDFSKIRDPHKLCVGEKWKIERFEVLKVVHDIVVHFLKNNNKVFSTYFPNISIVNENIVDPDSILLLIDDNMYYRSMRYEYYKLAKTYNIGFCQFFFNVSLNEALKCNKDRDSESYVHESIIKSMFTKIEFPLKKNSWEINSMIIPSYADFHNINVFNIFSFIKNSLANPVKTIIICSQNGEAQQNTNSNAIHQIDNTLKQLVGISLKKEIKNSVIKPNILSQCYSDNRHALLKQIKDGTIVLPLDLSKPINQEEIELIKPILSHLLHK